MRLIARVLSTAIALTFVACSDSPYEPEIGAPTLASETLINESTGDEIELKRPIINVTDWVDSTTLLSDLILPAGAEGIGPGSAILITIPNEGRFGCTANFVWKDGTKLYLGAAGHCFVPAAAIATHGPGADYDASGVTVQVCVDGCEGNFRTALLVGTMVNLGKVAYARQSDQTGEEGVGNDFGVVEIPAGVAHLVRPEMPVWGRWGGVSEMEYGKFACHYGNGVGVGEIFLTKARIGVGGGGDSDYWMGDFAGAFGDSGSGIIGCETDGLTVAGTGAIGVLTHLGIGIGDVKYKNLKIKAEHGVIFGTTVRRAIEMGGEARLTLALVEP